MKFSVIITTWNCEPWIEECRASVRAAINRYGQPVQVIEVCNGGGPGIARNEGLDKAQGEYVVFVDGDDTIAENTFVTLKDISADIVTFLPPNGTWDMCDSHARARIFSPLVGNLLAWNAVYKRTTIGTWRFPALHTCEDLVWTAGMFARAKSIESGVACWYYYREVLTGLSHTYTWQRVGERLRATELIRRACRGGHSGLITHLILLRKLTLHLILHVLAIIPKIYQ